MFDDDDRLAALEFEARRRLVHTERLSTVGRLTAGLAHEMCNVLPGLLTSLTLLEELLAGELRASPHARELLADIRLGARKVHELAGGVRRLARCTPAAVKPVSVRDELHTALALARQEVMARARLQVEVAERLPRVVARPGELTQVFLNLLVNAAQAIPEGDASAHEVRVVARAEDGAVIVAVRDTGTGVPHEVRRRLFEPFVTTKPDGTGLGLSICRALVEGAGGQLALEEGRARGAGFRVRLPAAGPGDGIDPT